MEMVKTAHRFILDNLADRFKSLLIIILVIDS